MDDFNDDSPTAELDSNIIINSLSKHLSQLKMREKNYYELHSQLITLENRYAMLLEEKNRTEKSFDLKQSANSKQINALKSEITNFQSEISQQRIENEELKINKDNLKGVLEKRLMEIAKLRENIDAVKYENNSLLKAFEEADSGSAQQKLAQQNNFQKFEELKRIRQELKSIEEKNETKRKYLMEKVKIIERTRNDNQNKNNEISMKNKDFMEEVQKREAEIKELNKIYLTLESDFNYNQAVTKKNENEMDQVLGNLNSIQVRNNEVSYEITKKQNVIKNLEEKIWEKKENVDLLGNENETILKDKENIEGEIRQILLNIKEENLQLEKVKSFFHDMIQEDKKIFLELDKKKMINSFFERNFNTF